MPETKVFVFSWNCESISTCKAEDKCLESNICSYCIKKKCYIPTFAKHIVEYVYNNNIDIVHIATQEDPYPGGNMHSSYLKKLFFDKDYVLLDNARHKFIGVGRTTITERVARGLRSSVYIRSDYLKDKTIVVSNKTHNCGGMKRNKGGIGINLNIDGTNLLFANCHLPFNSESLISHKGRRDKFVKKQTNCLNAIYTKLHNTFNDSGIILCGDLNYRINLTMFDKASTINSLITKSPNISKLKDLYNRDELKKELDKRINAADQGIIPKYDEGIDNKGPTTFYPTCKLYKQKYSDFIHSTSKNGDVKCNQKPLSKDNIKKKSKKEVGIRTKCQANSPRVGSIPRIKDKTCYKLGKDDQRAPSWCDRILHYTPHISPLRIRCMDYNSYDFSQIMAMSDHAAVYGFYTVNI